MAKLMAKINYNSKAPQPLEPVKQRETSFYNMPNSPASNLFLDVLGAGADVADLPDRKRQVNHNTEYDVSENGKRRLVTLMSQKASVTIELTDIDKITGSNKAAKKLFVLFLIKANEQAIHNGQLTKDYISFPLQELVDIGFYTTPQSARKGFRAGFDALKSVEIGGKVQKTKKREITQEGVRVLFTGYDIDKGQCVVYLNNHMNWAFLIQYFTILPSYYFRLPNRASDLLYYIFFLARQHTKDIEERGYFTISFRAIQHKLQLPNEVGSPNPQRDIKDAIENAIEQLEIEHSKTYGNTDFSLLPVYDEKAQIADYLNNGYLKVELKGAFAEKFIAISKDTTKQIETAQKRQARITERAVAINTAKKLESEKKTEGKGGEQ